MQTNRPDRNVNSKARYIIKALVVLILILATTCLVYLMGGTDTASPHMMYIPIILSAYYFGIIGAVGTALLGGLALGPLMPQIVSLGLMQSPITWIFRLAIFIAFGITVAILFNRIKEYSKTEIDRLYVNTFTGLPNANKLEIDLKEIIARKTNFSLIGFRIINIDDINRCIDYEIGAKAIREAAAILASCVDSSVYSIYTNEFAVFVQNDGIENAKLIGEQFLEKISEPLCIDQFRIELLIKGGIISSTLQLEEPIDLMKKMGIALSQGANEIGLYVYDDVMEQRVKRKTELVSLLINAIKDEEFYLVYQPKKSLNDDKTLSVEALIRWNNRTIGQISPGEFIKVAEEIGFIGEITTWVIKNVIDQKEKWKKAGRPVIIAFNMSPKDVNNSSVMDFFNKMIENKELDLSLLEIELTERGMLENKESAVQLFNDFQKRGIKITLDDFGTGFNSLENFVQFPTDHIKIDKIFIDNIMDNTYLAVIKHTINCAHQLEKKVIAEGVERKEQFDALKNMGCDYIQGYYLSKPLPPDELMNYYSAEVNH